MLILAIDTSCDDASVAISRDDCLLSNVVSSQVAYHSFWGGVVPSIAKRRHQETIDGVIAYALKIARVTIEEIDVIAVTIGPGLAIALEVGIAKARELATQYNKKIVAVNHMEGHIYANFAKNSSGVYLSSFKRQELSGDAFPLIALLISGGHTELVLMEQHLSYKILGKTLDDAVGEAYDKVARMLNIGYPGGPIIERLAKNGDRHKYNFPVSMKDGTLRFSYSGLKTAVMRQVELSGEKSESLKERFKDAMPEVIDAESYVPALSSKPTYTLDEQTICDIAASFEHAASAQIIYKIGKVIQQVDNIRYLLIGGGVAGNKYIRSEVRSLAKKSNIEVIYPLTSKLTMDNAGMIAIVGYYKSIKQTFSDPSMLDRKPQWSLSDLS